MEWLTYAWIALFIVFLIIEGVTHNLVTIWFAGGALIAYLLSWIGLPFWLQLLVFIVSSTLMLIYAFPFARERLNVGGYKTNVDSLAGKTAVVKDPIDFNTIGTASVHGVIWSATGEGDFQAGETVVITGVEGNKLIVEKANN